MMTRKLGVVITTQISRNSSLISVFLLLLLLLLLVVPLSPKVPVGTAADVIPP
jgi:hypothetical protein